MQIYFSKETALRIANDLLSIPPEAACKEFSEEISSTLKETASIFGNQYINVISEHTRVPIISGVPAFKAGSSVAISESASCSIDRRVEFALSIAMSFGESKSGKLMVLLEPESMDSLITRLN